ncbi:hypothetical protein [Glycomyces salinus]|uniref:hypothetical protein n=1 Tax=Glycomyces salinus TaxID=980294 RepID=UPI0018EDB998|nr:hypothetical protein [Glycomyces salinus]
MSLSSTDIDHLAAVLAQGKRPKVMFTESAGQVAGRSGKVVELAQPREGDFVVVAFGSDQLPFSPAELRMPARGETARSRTPRQRERERAPAGPGLLEPEKPTAESKPARERKPVADQNDAKTDEVKPAAPARKRAARPRAGAKHPELTVTLTYEDGSWAVSASKGARTAVKGAEVSHAAALAMCAAAESEEVSELVSEVVERIRAEAAEEAERLRKRLEEAEARLAELGR